MKKFFALSLAFTFLFASVSFAEESQTFDFTLQATLNPSAFTSDVTGWADLLSALTFRGTCACSDSSFHMDLTVAPSDPSASPVSLCLFGTPAEVYIRSPLLGSNQILFSNDSLLEFCVKAYEHLDLPLQNLALLHPYIWTGTLSPVFSDFDALLSSADDTGAIPADAVSLFASRLNEKLQSSKKLQLLISSIGLSSGADESFSLFAHSIPSYFTDTLGVGLTLRQDSTSLVLSSSSAGTFFIRSSAPDHLSIQTLLPETSPGLLPSFDLSATAVSDHASGQLSASLLSPDENLFSLTASFASLPLSWPADASSVLTVNLTGDLFPAFGVTLLGSFSSSGAFTLDARKPSDVTMLTLSGILSPSDSALHPLSSESYADPIDILRVNDQTLRTVMPDLLETFVPGFILLLRGIPASACQSALDALESSGILDMLLQ